MAPGRTPWHRDTLSWMRIKSSKPGFKGWDHQIAKDMARDAKRVARAAASAQSVVGGRAQQLADTSASKKEESARQSTAKRPRTDEDHESCSTPKRIKTTTASPRAPPPDQTEPSVAATSPRAPSPGTPKPSAMRRTTRQAPQQAVEALPAEAAVVPERKAETAPTETPVTNAQAPTEASEKDCYPRNITQACNEAWDDSTELRGGSCGLARTDEVSSLLDHTGRYFVGISA